MPWDVIVVGAGAAGLLAATCAAERGRKTLLLEKNRQPGVKILMSGGTRCNITHACDSAQIIREYGSQGRFLHSALAALNPQQVVQLFHDEGVLTKVEPTGKIFPVSDRASDVLDALVRRLTRSGAELATEEPVTSFEATAEGFQVLTPKRMLETPRLVITTGGRSYPGSGTTGDAYGWLARLGHTIVEPRPALTPISLRDAWPRELQGITVPDVSLAVVDPEAPPGKKSRGPLARRRGSLLFAHFGLSGPAALDVSRVISGHAKPASLEVEIDFAPDVKEEELDRRLQQLAAAAGGRQLGSALPIELPHRLIEALLVQSGVDPAKRAAELSRDERRRLTRAIKALRLRVEGTLGFKKAEVTAGGVALKEVHSSTMESKLVPHLHLAGEVLDLDGPIGGYNFQAAFSTGWLAGESV